MFAVKQAGDEFVCALVEADELGAELFRSEQRINGCRVKAAQTIGAGKIEVYLCSSADQPGWYCPGV